MWKSRFILMRRKKAELEAREKLENGTYVYKGLTEAEVENQVHMGRVNQTGESIFKTNKEIIRDHTLTYFNFSESGFRIS